MNKIIRLIILAISLVFYYSIVNAKYQDNTPPIRVVASFSILADVVQNVAGNKVLVTSIVGPNQDAHDYEVKPSDIMMINKSQALFVNGLGLEANWLTRLTDSYHGDIVIASHGVAAIYSELHDKHQMIDPHIWGNPLNVANIYVPNILAELIKLDPKNKQYYIKNAQLYQAKLYQLDNWVRQNLKSLIASNNKVVTTHDAFTYFAKRYQLHFIAVQGVSTDSDASAHDVAMLENAINHSQVRVVFLENMTNNQLMEEIATDTHAKVGGKLYSDALSKERGVADTYINMIKTNVQTILNSMKSN